MGIAQKVSRDFSDAVRARGRSYFAKGRVAVTASAPNEVVARVRGTAKYRVRLDVKLVGDPWARVHPAQIQQVLLNLLINARQAMPQGGTVRVRLGLDAAGRRAELSVTFSIPTLDDDVWRKTEPGTAHPRQRLRAVERLAAAGLRVGVGMAPILPGLTDRPEQLEQVVRAARDGKGTSEPGPRAPPGPVVRPGRDGKLVGSSHFARNGRGRNPFPHFPPAAGS